MKKQDTNTTTFDPSVASKQIKQNYEGYISTTFHFRDEQLRDNLQRKLAQTVTKGPFVEIKDIFREGKSIGQLIQEGTLSPLFADLEKDKASKHKLPLSRPLYAHQEQAIKAITSGHNVVVSTGTGSGKTNCFLIPILDALLRQKSQGTLDDGIRALLVYPMNALANDQIKGFREILMEYPDITFGVYNGGTLHDENNAQKLYTAMYAKEINPKLRKALDNERLSREAIKEKPPHILFTNYAMLEHLLLRPGDDVLFQQSNFRFVVLDEAHVYYGATGIETALLMSRLRARLNSSQLQFILTSATLGSDTHDIDSDIVKFASNLTGCEFLTSNIIKAQRNDYVPSSDLHPYPIDMFVKLYNPQNPTSQVLQEYGIDNTVYSDNQEIYYDLLSRSQLYAKLRTARQNSSIQQLSNICGTTEQEMVALVALCTRAKRDGKPLLDARYHFFVRSLEGCYLALDYKDSLSLIRKSQYKVSNGNSVKMFEIGCCDGCGELGLIGIEQDGQLLRVANGSREQWYQIDRDYSSDDLDTQDEDSKEDSKVTQPQQLQRFLLCKSCGAIVEDRQKNNNWCSCNNKNVIKLIKNPNSKCINCNDTMRRFVLGFDAATSVLATSLYEQIPQHTITIEQRATKPSFFGMSQPAQTKQNTGSQFLIFSDSRQGAAKFACYLEDSYKEFSRRRGIFDKIEQQNIANRASMPLGEFVQLLATHFDNTNIFRPDNSQGSRATTTDNQKQAWAAIINELARHNSRTSLVALGKLKFDYMGNNDTIVNAIKQRYAVDDSIDIKSFLNYLVFEIVKASAISTATQSDSIEKIGNDEREYIFFSPAQKYITKEKVDKYTPAWMPKENQKKDGTAKKITAHKYKRTIDTLKCDQEQALEFLSQYFDYLCNQEQNSYSMISNDGTNWTMPASNFSICFETDIDGAIWVCDKCGKTTQFHISSDCMQTKCGGSLKRLDVKEAQQNYYARLYNTDKYLPLFVKEHTAQLSKNNALNYQLQFVDKSINALSCSTTFEMGVDVGDLETVFLRNIPPFASNYAQRVGRAGRSVDAAAFALTYARLSSHDFTFFDDPTRLISGQIQPPIFSINNPKIVRRHIYATVLSEYFRKNPEQYNSNKIDKFIIQKGYLNFVDWLQQKPQHLKNILQSSIPNKLHEPMGINDFGWLDDFCGDNGVFRVLVDRFQNDLDYLEKEYKKALKASDLSQANIFEYSIKRYKNRDLIEFLVRGNILPKYGFPVDSVELEQNIRQKTEHTLNLSRDLSLAIAEYAPSSEIVADGKLYTSRYIKKTLANSSQQDSFQIGYIAKCDNCNNTNFRELPVPRDGVACTACKNMLKDRAFKKSIHPKSGFVAEENTKPVSFNPTEKNYKSDVFYVWNDAAIMEQLPYEYTNGKATVQLQVKQNDSLVAKSTNSFFVCSSCGYSIANDEKELLVHSDYNAKTGIPPTKINMTKDHKASYGKFCSNRELRQYSLHHEFKTDVCQISFDCDTSDIDTMRSVSYALLNSVSRTLDIEARDIATALAYKLSNNKLCCSVCIYDTTPGGAGYSGRLVANDGKTFEQILLNAYNALKNCNCDPSCYQCLRSYNNQNFHEQLDRNKAAEFIANIK